MVRKHRIRSRRRRTRRQRTRRQRGGVIKPEDYLLQDYDAYIVKPEVKQGILVFSNFSGNVCREGLKTGKQLAAEGINIDRSKQHPMSFFRAPSLSGPIDYTSVESEIESSFGKGEADVKHRVWIRVDPAKTHVYSSEIRAQEEFYPKRMVPSNNEGFVQSTRSVEEEVDLSRKTMTDYLRTIGKNAEKVCPAGQKAVYHLHSSEIRYIPEASTPHYPFHDAPINKTSEVLIRRPHIPPEWFVKCTYR